MFSPHSLLRFPIWQFLNQPLFQAHNRAILNPHRFWCLYQIELLERCLRIDCTFGDVRRD